MDETIVVPKVTKRSPAQFFKAEDGGQKKFGNNQSAYMAFLNLKAQPNLAERADLSPKSQHFAESTEEDIRNLTPFQEKMLELQLGNSGLSKSWLKSTLEKEGPVLKNQDLKANRTSNMKEDFAQLNYARILKELEDCYSYYLANEESTWRTIYKKIMDAAKVNSNLKGLKSNKVYLALHEKYYDVQLPGKLNFDEHNEEPTQSPCKPKSPFNGPVFAFSPEQDEKKIRATQKSTEESDKHQKDNSSVKLLEFDYTGRSQEDLQQNVTDFSFLGKRYFNPNFQHHVVVM